MDRIDSWCSKWETMTMKIRICSKCDSDISDRKPQATLCIPCSKIRNRKQVKKNDSLLGFKRQPVRNSGTKRMVTERRESVPEPTFQEVRDGFGNVIGYSVWDGRQGLTGRYQVWDGQGFTRR